MKKTTFQLTVPSNLLLVLYFQDKPRSAYRCPTVKYKRTWYEFSHFLQFSSTLMMMMMILMMNALNVLLQQDIGTVYQIFADEVLGSGQFGVVYGGMSVYV